jgi:hypothetical protein
LSGLSLAARFAVWASGLIFDWRQCRAGQTASPTQAVTQRPFDLGIQATQIIVSPALHGIKDLFINTQGKGFFAHGALPRMKRTTAGTNSAANGRAGSL